MKMELAYIKLNIVAIKTRSNWQNRRSNGNMSWNLRNLDSEELSSISLTRDGSGVIDSRLRWYE